jgi:anaerobic selenocysteine-containing dehydrogenase
MELNLNSRREFLKAGSAALAATAFASSARSYGAIKGVRSTNPIL